MQFFLTIVGALAVSIFIAMGSGGNPEPAIDPSALVPVATEEAPAPAVTEPSPDQNKPVTNPTPAESTPILETKPVQSPAPSPIIPALAPAPSPAIAPSPAPTSPAPSPAPTPAPKPAPTPEPSTSEPSCHPSYSGCLNPNASDYDCRGGSGNGPYYTGPVRVIGPDIFDLDRDNDGWGCE